MATSPSVSRMHAGKIADLPDNRCIAVADGAAVLARIGDDVVAFKNECLHQQSPLADGLVRDDALTCPMHFWRYQLPSGELIGAAGPTLERYQVLIEEGDVWVEVPTSVPEPSIRDKLREHARVWERDA